jgi:hypothetical protein
MKKLYYLLFLIITTSNVVVYSQVFNTSSTLKPGIFCTGFEPGIYINNRTDAYIFLNGGVGITHGIDFGAKVGFGGDEPYLGADIEFSTGKIFSFSAGAHSWGNFGLDGTALFTFPLSKKTKFYTGLDSDLIFAENFEVPVWIPLGVEISIQRSIFFTFEAEVNLTNDIGHFIGTGLNFVF